MDPILGIVLLIAFPILLFLSIAAFARFSVDPE